MAHHRRAGGLLLRAFSASCLLPAGSSFLMCRYSGNKTGTNRDPAFSHGILQCISSIRVRRLWPFPIMLTYGFRKSKCKSCIFSDKTSSSLAAVLYRRIMNVRSRLPVFVDRSGISSSCLTAALDKPLTFRFGTFIDGIVQEASYAER